MAAYGRSGWTSSVTSETIAIIACQTGCGKRIIRFAVVIGGEAISEVVIVSFGAGSGDSAGVIDESVPGYALSAGLGEDVEVETWQIG